jgi:hypothetical protein
MQSISDALGKTEDAGKWREVHDKLRRQEAVEGSMSQVISNQPYNSWSVVFRAYFSSKYQRWQEASDMLKTVEQDFLEEDAYMVLRDAIVAQKLGPEVLEAFSKKIAISQ